MIQHTVLLGALAIAAYKDWMEKKVYINIVFITGITGLILHMIDQNLTIPDMLGGAGVGAVMLLAAWISKESIGMGDGLMLMVCGIFLGFWENIELLFTAILLAGGAGIFTIIIRRKGRNYRMPFLPILLAAYLLILL